MDSPTARLLVELGAIIFGLGVLGRLARLVRLSPIPLYLLAGLAFGRGGLLPVTTSEVFLREGAEIGVILLLLLLGLEYSAGELVGNLRTQAPVGALNLLLNMTPGVVAGLLLGWSPVAALAAEHVLWIGRRWHTTTTIPTTPRIPSSWRRSACPASACATIS